MPDRTQNATYPPHTRCTFARPLLFASMLSVVVMLSACADRPANEFQRVPPHLMAAVEATDSQFMDRNAEAMGAMITEDFSGWSVTEKGPAMRIQGREQTVQMLSVFFKNTNWVDSEVYMLGMVDNILVQVEDDTYETKTGRSTVRTLNLYEFKDGKRWRNWKFFPVEDQ